MHNELLSRLGGVRRAQILGPCIIKNVSVTNGDVGGRVTVGDHWFPIIANGKASWETDLFLGQWPIELTYPIGAVVILTVLEKGNTSGILYE